MPKKMLIDAVHPEEMRVVITDNNANIHEFDFTTANKQQVKGNVYLAKVTRVEPSLQAAFVEYGGNKQGFLPFSEIHPDYYQIPVSDRKRLIEEEEKAAAAEEALDEEFEKEDKGAARKDDTETGGDTIALKAEAPEAVVSEVIEDAPQEAKEQSSETTADAEKLDADKDTRAEGEKGGFRRRRRRRRRGGDSRRDERSRDGAGDEGIETLNSDDEVERPARKAQYSRRYKIQEVIKRNQILLVQVTKEERGNKGVSLSTFMSLAGRYCVLMPNSPRGGGISRKISARDDRKKLKKIITDLELPKGMSVIVRTAGANRTRAEIKRDFDYLVKLWNQIREDTLASSAPALIYEESNLIKRTIRDSYNNDIDSIIVEGDDAYKEAKAFMRMLVPSHAPKVKQHKSSVPLFHKYNVENQLLSMYEPVVKLQSGGYLVLNPTEAMISIDVNSGRATGERNVEETAVKTNTEAAREIARQLKLRDLAGLIVIDFIDMMDGKNRRKIEHVLKDALRGDRARIQVGHISPFGLLEMSRQRLRPSISESVNLPCPHCNGTGHVRSDASIAIQIIRDLEKEAGTGSVREFRVWVTPSVAMYLLNNMHEDMHKLQDVLGITLHVQIDNDLRIGIFRIEKIRRKDQKNSKDASNGNQKDAEKEAKQDSDKESAQSRRDEPKKADASAKDSAGAAKRADASKTSEDKEEKKKPRRRTRKTAKKDGKGADAKKDTDKKPERKKAATKNTARDSREPKSEGAPAVKDAKEPDSKPKEPAAPEPAMEMAAAPAEPKGPPRKGWWQKMV